MKYIDRVIDDEIAEIFPHLAAISIEGIKGVGKTETAKRIASTVREMDDLAVKSVGAADPKQLLQGKKPILLDEWQQIPAIWDAVRRAVDRNGQGRQFLLTGSATPLNPPTHSGAGRIVTFRMRPLSLFERQISKSTVSLESLLEGKAVPISGDSTINLQEYVSEIVSSGLPALRTLPDRARRVHLESYLQRIVDRDFKDQGLAVRNPIGLVRWMTAYAAATATTASFETIRDASTGGVGNKPSRSTIKPYRDILERLWILDEVPAWLPTRNHITGLTQPPKHHLADPAFAVQLLGLNEKALLNGDEGSFTTPKDGTLLGRLFESLVTLSVRVMAQQCEAKVKHLRVKTGAREIDLILERADQKVVAIEVKLSGTVDNEDVKNLHWLKEKIGADLLDAVVINTGPIAYRRTDGIAVIPAALLGP